MAVWVVFSGVPLANLTSCIFRGSDCRMPGWDLALASPVHNTENKIKE
jgi:hypothetical protein